MVWEGVYMESKGTGSLNYISLGVGFIIGLQFCGRVLDKVCFKFEFSASMPVFNHACRFTRPKNGITTTQGGLNFAFHL